jgi:hypothetical protein
MRWLASGIGVALLVGCLATVNAQTTKTITMWDACDPDSFNMAAQSTICIAGHHGTTLFEDFIAELRTDKIAGYRRGVHDDPPGVVGEHAKKEYVWTPFLFQVHLTTV